MCSVKKKNERKKKEGVEGDKKKRQQRQAERVPALSLAHIRQYRVRM